MWFPDGVALITKYHNYYMLGYFCVFWYFSYFMQKKISPLGTKKWYVRDKGMRLEGGGEGGQPLLAVMKEGECITGNCVLYERDREGFTKKEMTWKRDSQSEREARQPLKRTLRFTPLHSPPILHLQIFHVLRRLFFLMHLMLFCLIIKARGVW